MSRRASWVPVAAGLAVGLVCYFGVAIGLLRTLWGPGGALLEGDSAARGLWIGRVFGDWIDAFTYVAFFVAMFLLFDRARDLRRQQRAFSLDLLGAEEDTLVLPDDAAHLRKRLRSLSTSEQSLTLLELLSAGLQRARANWSAEDVGQAVKTQAELIQGRIETEYALIKYLAWAIPSIGFIGTVLGIGQAMGSLETTKGESTMAVAARHLSMAFDTTFVALILSLILMYVLYRVQAADDHCVVRATDWCMRRFVFRMHVSPDQPR